MTCYLCKSTRYAEILNKEETYIWTNTNDDTSIKRKNKCILYQCKDCGHIYQPIDSDLRKVLREIYLSKQAQLSTPMGMGNWGIERAKRFFDVFDRVVDLNKYKSAVEIGCADGYLLKYLKSLGFNKLVGIEPSITKGKEKDGVLFIKAFADEKLKLNQKFGLIFSAGVFEHIEKIHRVIRFCRSNLREDGTLFFSVPNAKRQLEDGDPDLFTHEHIHYYTPSTLEYLLSKNGFSINSIISTKDSINVSAQISNGKCERLRVVLYDDYQQKLEKNLVRIKKLLENKANIVHGANNALNNILNWLKKDYDFDLVDNDETKVGKTYFNKSIKSMKDIDLTNYKTVIIIPTSFYEEIRIDYIKKGFQGKFVSVTPLSLQN
ncbi:MAG: class I SAM-dependent methyltransferase [Candidatus Hodarchaeota archaeon]